MRSPVLCSTVRTRSSGPSSAYAALSLTRRPVPWNVLPESEPTKEGISTSESRGSEIIAFPLSPTCRIIMESVRLPPHGAGVELLLLLGGHALAAVGADDQVVGAVAVTGAFDDLGQVDLAVELGVGPEVRTDGDREQRHGQRDRADLDPALPVGRGTGRAAAQTAVVPAAAPTTTTAAAALGTVDLAGVVAAVVAVPLLPLAARRALVAVSVLLRDTLRLRRCRRTRAGTPAALDVRHRAGALGLRAAAAATISVTVAASAAPVAPPLGPLVHGP